MLLALIIFLVVLLAFQLVILILIKDLTHDVATLESDMTLIRRAFKPPPEVGGRPVPSAGEIAAARLRSEAVPNQVDSAGTAQPGGHFKQ